MLGAAIDDRERVFGSGGWLANVLSNHDQPRQASRLAASAGIADTDAVAKAAALLLLTMRGTPFLYYGEELGMRDVPVPDDEIIDPPARRALIDPEFSWYNRDQCRSPMPWTSAPNGHGFTTGRPWLRLADDADRRNVAAQADDPDSVLSAYRRFIRLRWTCEALLNGRLERAGEWRRRRAGLDPDDRVRAGPGRPEPGRRAARCQHRGEGRRPDGAHWTARTSTRRCRIRAAASRSGRWRASILEAR